ncbi:MAG: hypothetical protein ACD_22C00117G0004 [uncultured bacterium]|nr:MAG: hypothetical protein ACD_22C00117G0004 [uncultured bacterium]
MYLPIIKKIKFYKQILMERCLPEKGYITVKVGDTVLPFSKLGFCKVSHKSMVLGADLKLAKGKSSGNYFYKGDTIGHINGVKVEAPFTGYLNVEGDHYIFVEEQREFWLLSGVWGEVVKIIDEHSVLLATQVVDVSFAAAIEKSVSGELVTFPNPEQSLLIEYLENFSKNIQNKILYVGEFLSKEVVNKAIKLGALGIIAGSSDVECFNIAKDHGMFLGIITGFGTCSTPAEIFEFLKNITNRFVFVSGAEKYLRIPVPADFEAAFAKNPTKESTLRAVKKGITVLVLQKPHFGRIGVVDSVSKSSIFVKFPDKDTSYEVSVPNILSLE